MKLALGTVQFGMAYGVSNKNGQTSKDQAAEILDYASQNGIDLLDTATSYGNSEEMLGQIIKDRHWRIISKTPRFPEYEIGAKQREEMESAVRASLQKLKQKELYGLFIHRCDDLFKPGGERLFEEAKSLVSSGLATKIGVSVYNEQQVDRLLQDFDVDIVQIPINIIDQRFLNSGCIQKLKSNLIEIHARSAFLQGLLLMSQQSVPSYFHPIKEKLKQFVECAHELGISKLELALKFVYDIGEIDQVVVGVNTLDQLKEIVTALKSELKIKADDYGALSVNDPAFVNPSLWKI